MLVRSTNDFDYYIHNCVEQVEKQRNSLNPSLAL